MGRFEESSGEHGGKPLASANAANGKAVNRGQKPLASANAANRNAVNRGRKPLASANAANWNAVNRGRKPLASANAANKKVANRIAANWKVMGLSPIRCFSARPAEGVWVGRFLGVGRSLDSDRSS